MVLGERHIVIGDDHMTVQSENETVLSSKQVLLCTPWRGASWDTEGEPATALLLLSRLLALKVRVSSFSHKGDRKGHLGHARWLSGEDSFRVVQPVISFPDALGGASALTACLPFGCSPSTAQEGRIQSSVFSFFEVLFSFLKEKLSCALRTQ